MASVIRRPQGHKWIQFKGRTGKRQTIRLGKTTAAQAHEYKYRIECLLAADAMGHPPDLETARWVGSLSAVVHSRFAAAGLAQRRSVHLLGELLDRFLASLAVQASTRDNVSVVCDNLASHLGRDRLLSEITPADAIGFRSWLATHGRRDGAPLAMATVSRRCRRAKQILAYAVKNQWLTENPFAALKGGTEENHLKDVFVAIDMVQAVLDEVPDWEFRSIIVLARFGGLRCPSEVLPLRWDAVNWDQAVMRVASPKTARYPDGQTRVLPLFPEMHDVLAALWETASMGEALMFPHHQVTGARLTNKLRRACWASGQPLWVRPWQNMRASLETELLNSKPIHVVANWFGHSPAIALKHYAQIVKEQVAKAANVKLGKSVLRFGDSPGKAKQKAKLHGAP